MPPLIKLRSHFKFGQTISRTYTRTCPLIPKAHAPAVWHLAESWILLGSAAVSLSIPVIGSRLRGNQIEHVSPSEAFLSLSTPSTHLLDIRMPEQVQREGVPFHAHEKGMMVVQHAPWLLEEDKSYVPNPHFEDDVLFVDGVHADTSFVILDSDGSMSAKAAQAIAKLGNNHDICVVRGGFKAWEAAGLPTGRLKNETKYLHTSSSSIASMDVPEEILQHGSHPHRQAVFHPKLLDVLSRAASGRYTLDDLKQDVLSGMTVGIVALSLSMALGIASESTPAIGLYTAVIAGFLISALGGSTVAIGGPTAAFIPIVIGIAHQYGPTGLVISTGLAGAMLVAAGALGLGSAVKFVPRPVVTGFTAGIATYILSTQIKDFLGMGVPGHLPNDVPVPSEFLEKLVYLGGNISAAHGPSAALALSCFALMKLYPSSWKKTLPPQIVAVLAGTAGLVLIDGPLGLHSGIETIGSHFGANAIPSSIPSPHLPEGFSLDALPNLIQPSFTIALLAAIESLLCARVADTMTGDRHNPNTELIAQGVANIASAAFGGLPATGALARTAANIKAGARSPVSGVIHAVTVLAVILVAAPAASYIPLPTLSAVLVIVALNMGEWRNFTLLPNWPEKDAQLFLCAFTLTLLQDVAVAVEVGMAAALLLFVSDVTSSTRVRAVPPGRALAEIVPGSNGYRNRRTLSSSAATPSARNSVPTCTSLDGVDLIYESSSEQADEDALIVPHGAAYIEVSGSLLFGAGELLEEALEDMSKLEPVQVLLLDMSHVSVVDVSGLEVMEEQYTKLQAKGKQLVLCGLSRQPLRILSKSKFLDHIGRENVCRSVEEAVYRAKENLQQMNANTVSNNAVVSTFLGKGDRVGEQVPKGGLKSEGAAPVQ